MQPRPTPDPALAESADLAPVGRVTFDRRSRQEVEFIFREIFADDAYNKHGVELAPGAVVLDVGANIGLFSLYAALACRGDLEVFAFEPAPTTFGYLLENLETHGLLDRVHPLQVALGRAEGRAKLTVYPALPGNSTFTPEAKAEELAAHRASVVDAYKKANPRMPKFLAHELERELRALAVGEEVEVELTTLARVMTERAIERVDLLKVDTEGSELEVLDGVSAELWPRVRQVVLETTGAEKCAAIEACLRRAGFDRIVSERPLWAIELGLENLNVYAVRG